MPQAVVFITHITLDSYRVASEKRLSAVPAGIQASVIYFITHVIK